MIFNASIPINEQVDDWSYHRPNHRDPYVLFTLISKYLDTYITSVVQILSQ